MEVQHINAKIFVEGDMGVDPREFIAIFQRWVKEQHREELLIDMADYRHVPNGPGVLCVGLQADYGMDHQQGRWGLLYNRKAPLPGANADRFAQALRSAAAAGERLESEVSGGLRFSRKEFELVVNDRAIATNSEANWAALKADVEAFLGKLTGGGDFSVERFSPDPRARLGARVRLGQPVSLAAS